MCVFLAHYIIQLSHMIDPACDTRTLRLSSREKISLSRKRYRAAVLECEIAKGNKKHNLLKQKQRPASSLCHAF